jgi:uncharacterized SAM-binding protein YcdF (DUF218 family)
MFFILSKLFTYFLLPFTWVMLLLVWRYFTRSPKRKKNLLIAACVVFLLFSNGWLLNLFARIWESAPVTIEAGKKYSCIIVLGGFVSADRDNNGYFNLSSDRFIQGVKLYKEGHADHILVSGGNGNLLKHTFKESRWAATQMQGMGVPSSAILIENDSRNTLENALFTKRVLDSAGLKPPYLLVTSAYHMRRSVWIFNKEGLEVIPYPCNYFAGRGSFNPMDILPQVHIMDFWFIYLKEVVGYYVYRLKAS